MGLKRICISVFLVLVAFGLQAQPLLDTLVEVSENEVVVQREKFFNAGTHSWKPDTNQLQQYSANTLGEMLGQQTGMFIRTYTPGTLATPIMRGTYGVQTAVVWNGFNIQGPMNQLVDLNLIPAFFIDEVELGYGSQSALYGSGAIGGTISFGQKGKENEGIHGKVLAGGGSFGSYQQGVKLSYKNKGYTGRVRYFNHTAQNDYSYSNKAKAGKPTEQLQNALWWNNAQMIENYFTINKNITATLHGWHTKAYRGVAPLMIQKSSVAYQKDDVWRVMGDVKYRHKKIEAIARISWFDERIRYDDLAQKPPLITDNRAFGLITEAEFRYKLSPRHDVSIGTNNSKYRSIAPNYGTPPPVQYRGAVFASHRYRSPGNRIVTSLTIRQEWVSARNIKSLPLVSATLPGKLTLMPFVPTLGAEWNFIPSMWLQGKASRLYRYPNFNDLYWTPGGNPNLKPESGYSAEARLAYKRKIKKLQITASAGGFYNDINNWILWLLGANNIWSPKNIQRVKARGIETELIMVRELSKKSYVKADVRYSYTISTNEKKKDIFDESYKKQLQYVPYHMGAGNISYGNNKNYLSFNAQYTGKQYTTADNTTFLPAFYTLNVFAGTRFSISKTEMVANLQVRNLTGKQYSVVEWLPMPGRNYLITLQFNF